MGYEDLLRDPRPVLTGILEHLGLEWNDAFAAGVELYQQREERTQAFRHDLGTCHVADLDGVIGERLPRHGYPVGP